MNGSDCGMFACKFAEYLSRRARISFTQEVTHGQKRFFVPDVVIDKSDRFVKMLIGPQI